MVVDFGKRSSLWTGVAVRERVVPIASDPQHLVVGYIYQNAADRGTDPTKTPNRPDLRLAHSNHLLSLIQLLTPTTSHNDPRPAP
jgi:hypothetical protein